MRILYLTPYVPSPVRVRPYEMIRHLVRLGHDVTLICLAAPGETQIPAYFRNYCREIITVPITRAHMALNIVRTLPSPLPLQAAYGASRRLVKEARRRADRHDVVHIEHLRGSTFLPPLRDYPLVFDAVDSISLLLERALRQSPSLAARLRALADLARTRRAEGALGQLCSNIIVTSAEDRWAIQQLQPAESDPYNIEVIANGVDLETFAPAPFEGRDAATLVFTGKMSYHANEAAALYLAREILPLVWRERPDVRCLIVGRDPTRAVRALQADPRIEVTGAVPSVAPFLQKATLAVAPLRYGVGIQNKVLEALATGTPLVATPQIVRAIAVRPGHDLALAATPAAFAGIVLRLLAEPQRRAALGQAGRRFVERNHDWHSSAARLAHVYSRAAARTVAA